MHLCANAKERTIGDWDRVFMKADRRFVLSSVTTPKNSALSMIDFVWDGEGIATV
jgi:hypothetical protein